MAFTPEELRQQAEQELRERKDRAAERLKASQQKQAATKKAEAASQATQSKAKQVQQSAQTAQQQQRNSGIVTQVGSALQYAASGDWLPDGLNAVAAGINQVTPDGSPIKDFTQGLDDKILSAKELDRYKEQKTKEVSQGDNLVDKAAFGLLNNTEAAATGVQAGVAIPVTLAARLSNQASPWADPPAVIKNSPVSETIFEIAQVLTPTLFGGGVMGALGKGAVMSTAGGLAVESAVETIPQDSADDLIAGRKLAEGLGHLANHLGFDGPQLTRDLIEGRTIQSQALVAGIGFLQNYGINFSADRLFRYFGDNVFKSFRNTDDAARVLGRSGDDVAKSIDNINTPLYDKLSEPHQVVDIDSAVPVSKPSKGRTFINDEAAVQAALRKNGIAEDGLSDADRAYFTNWSAVSDDVGIKKVLEEATSTLKRLKGFPSDMKVSLSRASDWWSENKFLLDDGDVDSVVHNFSDLTKTLESKEGVVALAEQSKGGLKLDTYLREYAATSEEGFIAAALVGEELGVRIQKLARQAINLDESFAESIDFADAVENLLNLHEKANLFLIPLRRGKRKWAVEGTLQQRKQLKRIKDVDIRGAVKKQDPLSSDAPARSFQTIKVDSADDGATLRELWERYQDGDDAAGATLKSYLRFVAYTDPSTALNQVDSLTNVLAKELKKGNSDATSNLFYAWMLSRPATQTASAASNIARLIAEPLGAAFSGKPAYGLGQLVGGWGSWSASHKVFMKALKDGIATNGGAKLDNVATDLKTASLKLDQQFLGAIKELNANGASDWDKLSLRVSYEWQKASLNPLVGTPGRLLMASDEWTKSIVGSQIATARAYQEAADLGISRSEPYFKKMLAHHMNLVFKDGVATGKILDEDVLRVAKNVTFQDEVPINGNFVDNAFLAMKDAADSSAMWRFVSPFTRVSHSILEVSARYEPSGVFRALVPKYKAILAGELGETAKLQLESQIAFGRVWSMGVVTAASLGFVTGVNSESLPKQSFILPRPDGKGYVALPYGKLEPFATITSIIADTVSALRDDVISEGEYDRALSNVIFGLGMATFDKTFMTGMTDFGSIFDAKNLSEGSLKGLGNILATLSPGVVRAPADWLQPYKNFSSQTNNPWTTLLGQVKSRAIGGIGNPIQYDELTGKPIPKVSTAGAGDNYWALVGASLVNEFIYPGKIQDAAKNDPVKMTLDKVNYKLNTASSIKTVEGISLTPEQQSILSKDLHDVANLRGKLQAYFDSSAFKSIYQQLQAVRRADSPIGSSDEGTRANAYRAVIHANIDAIRRAAKLEAISKGRLANDPDLQRKRQVAANDGFAIESANNNNDWKGLLEWAR